MNLSLSKVLVLQISFIYPVFFRLHPRISVHHQLSTFTCNPLGAQSVLVIKVREKICADITIDKEEMKKEKIDMIIETFTDYIEHYYDENSDTMDVAGIVNDHFEEFAEWACDDFVITEEERDTLLSSAELELRKNIKRIIVCEFLLILNS